ncbi:MAG TPA: hemolysin family protein [Anaerolineales bacterium]|nr:hemolysin family protein [Anaerolineales bacterium]
MTEVFLYIAGILLILPLDMLTLITRVGMLHAQPGRLLSQAGSSEARAKATMDLVRLQPQLQASLNFTQTLLRFIMVGLVVIMVLRLNAGIHDLAVLGILLAWAVLVFWIEWLVRTRIVHQPEIWAARLAPYARLLLFVFKPLVAVPQALQKADEKASGTPNNIMMDELINLVDAGQQEGFLEQEERKMIHSIFDLGDTLVREIMVPRIDVIALDVNTPLDESIDALLKSGFTRVPVYQDTIDKVLGLLYAKDLLKVWREGEQLVTLKGLLRPAYYVPEAKKADQLLAEMQSRRVHMAIVVDEYGGVAGLVTLEDIVEEIIGEIQDEYDLEEELPYLELGDGEYIFQGRVDLDDFNEVLESNLSKDEADTIGGLIYNRIGRVPASGESVQVGDLLLTVEQVSGRRIRKVRARRLQITSDQENHKNHVDG